MFFYLVLVILNLRLSYMTCVQLPNGLLLDTDGLVNSNRRHGVTITILKNTDGTPVVAEPITYMLVTETTVLGVTGYVAKRKRYEFAYRPDTGLVVRSEDPETHARLFVEAGPPIAGGYGSVNSVYSALRSRYHRVGCNQKLAF